MTPLGEGRGFAARFGAAFRAEIYKAVRSRSTRLALAAVALLSACAAASYRFVEDPGDPGTVHNAFGCFAYSASVGVWAASFVLVAFASLLVSQERGSGTLAFALSRPIGRNALFAAKAATVFGAPLAALAAALLPALALSAAFYGFGDVVERIPYGSEFLTWKHHGRNFMANRAFMAAGLSILPLCGLSCMGFLFSNAFRRPASSLGLAISAYFILEFVVRRFSEGLGEYLFNTYATSFYETLGALARGISTAQISGRQAVLSLGVSAAFSILSVAASFIIFRFRESG